MHSYKFTVFTPVYNRSKELINVYKSLVSQTYIDFEWLIVDDGSSDGTKEIVEDWINEDKLSINYIYKKNGGKHTAHNLGVKNAKGELFLILDSDDTCVENALEILLKSWDSIDKTQKALFSGITCLCQDYDENIIGDIFKEDVVDEYPIYIMPYMKGEKWGFHKTDILKNFLFPEYKNEKFIAESLIWNRISSLYKVRHINTPLRNYNYQNDGLSANSLKIRLLSPKGTRLFYEESLDLPFEYKKKLRNASNLIRYSLHGQYLQEIWLKIIKKPYLMLSFPLGFFLYLKDKREL